MTDREKLLDFLTNIRAFAQWHSGGTLGDHLMNVFDILDAMDLPIHTCLAGGLHAVYGTCFKGHVCSGQRHVIRELFGPAVEYIVYRHTTINRPHGLEDLNQLRDINTQAPVTLSPAIVSSLRVIEAANLLEQGVDLSQYPIIAATLDARLESLEGES